VFNRTFAQAVVHGSEKKFSYEKNLMVGKVRGNKRLWCPRYDKGTMFSAEVERIEWLKDCFVGRVYEVVPIEEFREIMVEEAFQQSFSLLWVMTGFSFHLLIERISNLCSWAKRRFWQSGLHLFLHGVRRHTWGIVEYGWDAIKFIYMYG
jgi:hypothetical protein